MSVRIAQVLTLVTSLIMIIPFFFKLSAGPNRVAAEFRNVALIIAAFAGVVGSASLFQMHAKKVARKDSYWMYSLILLASMVTMVLSGLFFGTPSSPVYKFLFNNIQSNLHGTFFAMLCFYIGSAAYRAFTIRNREAAILMVSGLLVMLGNIPLGAAIWSQFPVIGNWIMNVPNTAAMRGILFGSALGYVSVSLRVMLGLERTHFGGGEG